MRGGGLALAAGLAGLVVALACNAPRAAPAEDAAPPSAEWLWTRGGRPTPAARAAVAALAASADKGLDPGDYDASGLGAALHGLDARGTPEPAAAERFDAALTASFARFLSDLHSGRVPPSHLGVDVGRGHGPFDAAAAAAAAARGGDVAQAIAAVEPDLFVYRRLEEALHRYRSLAAEPGLGPVELRPTLRPGDPLPAAAALRRWLTALGDLAEGSGEPVTELRYDPALVVAVRRFQERHGLEPDGVIGPATARALAVPAGARARQIALTLERLRWLPPLDGQRIVAVNVPAFELWAFDAERPQGRPALQMRVVVGRATRWQTPLLAGALDRIEFHPDWDVPPRIAREEIAPLAQRNPGYLDAHEMELLRGNTPVPPTPENVAAIGAGVRVRQRPGPQNPLGRVKFSFPNPASVYLHDTPTRGVFQRSRRDFSHGCVRLEDAPALALWLLSEVPGWSAERVEQELAGDTSFAVRLPHPVPIFLFYATALAEPDGRILFFDDVYGHDRALERALAERSGGASSASGSTS
jgi:murein L,D-transpeptidase YcbB/YkuD